MTILRPTPQPGPPSSLGSTTSKALFRLHRRETNIFVTLQELDRSGQSEVLVYFFNTVFWEDSDFPTPKYSESASQIGPHRAQTRGSPHELLRLNVNKRYGPDVLHRRVLSSLAHVIAASLNESSICPSPSPLQRLTVGRR